MSAVCFTGLQAAGDSQVTFPVTVLSPPILYNGLVAEHTMSCLDSLREAAMNDQIADNRGPRRAIALAVAAAAAAMLATACSSSAPSSSAGAPSYAQVLDLAQCMRSHGVPTFPDPGSSGEYNLTSSGSIQGAGGASIDINSSQVQTAYGHCRQLVPSAPSISRLEQLEQQGQQKQEQALPQLLKYSQCMRSNGVPTFPDLGGSDQTPPPGKSPAFNPDSTQFQAASTTCQHLLPAGAHLWLHSCSSSS
jgi:hypothetical protein